MYVYGNSAWPTVQWLRSQLGTWEGEAIAWGVERENIWGGMPRVYGFAQLQMLCNAEVPVPKHTNNYTQALEWQRSGETLFARRTNHTQGKDIIVVAPRPQLFPTGARRRRDYWTCVVNSPENRERHASDRFTQDLEQIPCEWRVHSFRTSEGYKSIACGAKIRGEYENDSPSPQSNIEIRSRCRGWRVCFNLRSPKDLRPLAHRAVEALGYDFGAVDILDCGPETDERFVVLEVNSAPALLSEHTRNKYLTAIKERR